ncbi:MAG TPA: Glu/Leu/Phe/Val dehydrogenase [Bacillota bacterium]|jgi:leucine dehydrogenase
MEIFSYMERYAYEQLVFCYDKTSGLKAIICIHNTTLGPALGGCRFWTYPNEDAAILDALRLARGMTYKSAVAGLNLGGGKSVIIGNPRADKSETLFRAFGRYLESLQGRYITAEDVGTTVADMDIIHQETEFVAGVSTRTQGGSSGDPSPATAFGCWRGMKACAREVWGDEGLSGKTVSVQGVGNVGYHLARHLHDEGAKLIVADINDQNLERAVKEFGATAVNTEEIYGVKADIFAPCALGAILNDETIPQLKVQIIAGSANNQLKEERNGDELESRSILYAPDYVINAGGVINVADELHGYNRDRAMRKVAGVYDNVAKVIKMAKDRHIPTYKAADLVAEERISKIGELHKKFIP